MTLSHDVILIAYGLATAIGITLGVVVWRHRTKTGAVPLAMVLLGSTLFSGPRFVATAVDSVAVSVLMERLLYVGVGISVLAGVLLVLEYTGREHLVTRKTVALLSIEPILAVGFAFVNPGDLFFESLAADPSVPTGVAVDWGIAFGLHTAYSYLLMAAVTAMILEFLYTSRSLYRGQAAALLGAAILPWIANAVHVVGPVTADTTPIGYILLGSLYAVAIVRYRLIDVVPIARDRVLDTVSEGMFVIDRDDRLIDVNPAGRAMLDVDPSTEIIGRDIHALFQHDPKIVELFHELTDTPTESSAELAYDGRCFEIQGTPITDGRDRHVGWLALVYDITERKRHEEELERHNDRLDEFADLVSHDLRNPLTVASGYLELARETDDDERHLERVQQAHDRMETIIDDVLTLAREGAAVTDPQPVELGPVAEGAWNGVATGDATLDVRSSAPILADQVRLRRLLENLFRNTVEHGPADDGQPALVVTVGVDRGDDADGATVYVEDDGCGIPADQRERVFEGGYTTGDEGTGFGLSIVQQIAEAHGWSVTATEGTAGGARFEFSGVECGVIDGETGADDDPSESLESSEPVESAESLEWAPDTS